MGKSTTASNGQKINKSDAIREILARDPKAKSAVIVATLKDKGIKVAPSLIYFVKSQASKAKRKGQRDRAVESSRASGVSNPLELVIRVKNLAREVGGIKHLKQLVDLLAE